jgi:hypothetical protein
VQVSLKITILPISYLKKFLRFKIRSKSDICAVILNLALTAQPVLVEELFNTLTVNEPSASISPVTNQGSILDFTLVTLFIKVLDLTKLELDLAGLE